MSRLIDADKLNKKLTEKALAQRNTPLVECRELIHDAPTVDAVEVVRCKDCMYKERERCGLTRYTVREYDFCSCGERKEK